MLYVSIGGGAHLPPGDTLAFFTTLCYNNATKWFSDSALVELRMFVIPVAKDTTFAKERHYRA